MKLLVSNDNHFESLVNGKGIKGQNFVKNQKSIFEDLIAFEVSIYSY
jgi:hypothetical protein